MKRSLNTLLVLLLALIGAAPAWAADGPAQSVSVPFVFYVVGPLLVVLAGVKLLYDLSSGKSRHRDSLSDIDGDYLPP